MSQRAGWVIGGLLGVVIGLAALLVVQLGGGFGAAPRVGDVDSARQGAIVRATERVSPAVVSVVAFRRTSSFFSGYPLDDFLTGLGRGLPGPANRDQLEAFNFGSGFIIDERGYVLTNNHVVNGAERVVVTLSTGENLLASEVGSSFDHDLTVLKIDGDVSDLPVAPLGSSDDLRIGEWAIAIGSPYGYLLNDTSPTVTVGVISATHRDIRPQSDQARQYYDMLQTDASIHAGNSGGPLVNADGEVVGINTFILGGQGGSGIGFAVPIDRGIWVLDEILRYGRFRATWVGIERSELVSDLVRQNYRLRDDAPRGYLIVELVPQSPAVAAGVRAGDIVTAIDGEPVHNPVQLTRQLYYARVGSTLRFTVWRDGRVFEADVEVVEHPRARS